MEKKKNKSLTIVVTIFTIVIIILLSLFLAFYITYTKSTVKGSSMYPTFSSGAKVFINRFEKGKSNDIVVADIQKEENWDHSIEGQYIVKRLVANAGDRVKIENTSFGVYELKVNGELFYTKDMGGIAPTYANFKDYVNRNILDSSRIEDGAVIVKEGEVFLLGDNWETSYDSATVGPIHKDSIVGRVDIVVEENKNIFWGAIKGVFQMWF